MKNLIEKMANAFDWFRDEIVNSDIEKDSARIIQNFFYKYLTEFSVDVQNVKKVQLGQSVYDYDDIVMFINIQQSVNVIIPRCQLGLFSLIVPARDVLAPSINIASKFHTVSDEIMGLIFDEIEPFKEACSRIDDIYQENNKLKSTTNEYLVRISNINELIQEDENESKKYQSIIDEKEKSDEKRALELEIQQVGFRNEKLLRKKKQSISSLVAIEGKLEKRKEVMNRSCICDDRVLKDMEQELENIEAQINQAYDKTEEEIQLQNEQNKIKESLSATCSAISKISQAMESFNCLSRKLEEAKKPTETKTMADLDEINKEIEKETADHKKSIATLAMQIKDIEHTIEIKRKFENKQSKLSSIKDKLLDKNAILMRLDLLKKQRVEMQQAFIREENKLKSMEMKIVNKSREALEHNLKMSQDIILKIKKNKEKDCS